MANDNLVTLRHLTLSAMRSSAMVTSKVSELTEAFSQELLDLDDAKQNKLSFDSTPTEGSNNPVTSDGIAKYMTSVIGDINTILDEINGEVV